MSHIVDLALEIQSLESLEAACKLLGLELVKNQKTYKWFGRWVGDYPLPTGFSKGDLGKCQHAIRIPGNKNAYEIGVVSKRDGSQGFTLLWDFWAGGYGLEEKIGKQGILLKQAYSMSRTKKEVEAKGYRALIKKKKNGTMRLETY